MFIETSIIIFGGTVFVAISGYSIKWIHTRMNGIEKKKVSVEVFKQFEKSIETQFTGVNDTLKGHTETLNKILQKVN